MADKQPVDSSACTLRVGGHEDSHVHGPGCGHQTVAHGDHNDYVVNGQRHHPHEGHCDNHGQVNAPSPDAVR